MYEFSTGFPANATTAQLEAAQSLRAFESTEVTSTGAIFVRSNDGTFRISRNGMVD